MFDIETTGLEPMQDRITCISIGLPDGAVGSFAEEDEVHLLKSFIDCLQPGDRLVHFNGATFDVPFLIKRCVINNVIIKKFDSLDLRNLTNGVEYDEKNAFKKGKLALWAEKLGIKVDTPDGSNMQYLYMKGDWDEIKRHCEEDVMITRALYNRCREVRLI